MQVNNAGIVDGGPLDWTDMHTYRKLMEVNFFGMIKCCKAAMPLLKRSQGRIINVSSIAGQIPGVPCMGAYSSTKHASDAFTNSLRMELKPLGITVSSLTTSIEITAHLPECLS